MKRVTENSKLVKDLIILFVATAVVFALFHVYDTFELVYKLTRRYEAYELDEFFLLALALPGPLAWFAIRRSQDAMQEHQKRAESERRQARAYQIQSLGTLAGGIAHELNNQLLPLLSVSDLMRSDNTLDPKVLRKAELIYSAANRAKFTVEKVLAYSRDHSTDPLSCNVSEVAVDVFELLKVTCPGHVNLNFSLAGELGNVQIAASDLQSILVNLVSNAIDSLQGETGDVSIALSTLSVEGDSHIKGLKAGRYLNISITDSGSGMPSAILERMLEPFFTTKQAGQGLGLGLSIVNRIVLDAQGLLDVSSKVGEGTKFGIYIPSQD